MSKSTKNRLTGALMLLTVIPIFIVWIPLFLPYLIAIEAWGAVKEWLGAIKSGVVSTVPECYVNGWTLLTTGDDRKAKEAVLDFQERRFQDEYGEEWHIDRSSLEDR